jgi:hypothetical protein
MPVVVIRVDDDEEGRSKSLFDATLHASNGGRVFSVSSPRVITCYRLNSRKFFSLANSHEIDRLNVLQ